MLFPIRCITCGKVINHLYPLYQDLVQNKGKSVKDTLDELKIIRYCCRRMFICHNDIFDYVAEFDKKNYPFIQDTFENEDIIPIQQPKFPVDDNKSDGSNSESSQSDIDDDIVIDNNDDNDDMD